MEWIPLEYRKQHEIYQELAAWYSGSSERLLDYYLQMQSNGNIIINEYNLDKKGMFWEKDIHNDRATMLHIPVASDIASTSADLLFSEMPDVRIEEAHQDNAPSGSVEAQERLDTILDEMNMYSRLLELGETASSLGGTFVKIDWDDDLREFPVVIPVQPDKALWEFKWGFLQRVKFYKVIKNPDTNLYFRLEEIREKGRISYNLYRGTYTQLGSKIPLNSLAETQDLEPEINHGLDSLLAWYIPNKKPNRMWRGSDLGESDLFSIIGIMDSIDETYTNWVRDLRIARGRIIVPDYMLEKDNDDNKLKFNIDQEVFVGLEQGPAGSENQAIENIQFDIRAEQHYKTATELLKQAYSMAGYSPATFGLGESTNGATATEIKQQQSKSFKTRNKKAKYFKNTLEDMFYWVLQVDNKYFNGSNGDFSVQVNLQDSVASDPMEKADSIKKLSDARALSIDNKVRTLNPNWSEDQIEAEVKRIMEEDGMLVEEPDMNV